MYYYPGGGGGYMQQQPQPQSYSQYGIKGRPVSSLEEVRAAQIDFDGSLFVFPDVANKRIYTKQINIDGTASLKAYSLIESTSPEPSYVTKEEFDSTIKNLEALFNNKGKEQKYESNTSTTNNKPAISF